ncbi:MAG: hypothetical protein ABIP94_15530 [Planctomycetota bacterium]
MSETPSHGPETAMLAGGALSAPAPEATPFATAELRALVRSPSRALDIVLGERQRLAASIAEGSAPYALVAILAACTVLASLPYGLVRGWSFTFRIAAFYGGSVLLCWPSLQVFGAYLGSSLRPLQNLALALLIASVAALFTLGFAPIVWFLQATMADGDWIDADVAYVVLLALGLLAGLGQLGRCVASTKKLRPLRSSWLLLGGWQMLVVFVAWRMARALDLLG